MTNAAAPQFSPAPDYAYISELLTELELCPNLSTLRAQLRKALCNDDFEIPLHDAAVERLRTAAFEAAPPLVQFLLRKGLMPKPFFRGDAVSDEMHALADDAVAALAPSENRNTPLSPSTRLPSREKLAEAIADIGQPPELAAGLERIASKFVAFVA